MLASALLPTESIQIQPPPEETMTSENAVILHTKIYTTPASPIDLPQEVPVVRRERIAVLADCPSSVWYGKPVVPIVGALRIATCCIVCLWECCQRCKCPCDCDSECCSFNMGINEEEEKRIMYMRIRSCDECARGLFKECFCCFSCCGCNCVSDEDQKDLEKSGALRTLAYGKWVHKSGDNFYYSDSEQPPKIYYFGRKNEDEGGMCESDEHYAVTKPYDDNYAPTHYDEIRPSFKPKIRSEEKTYELLPAELQAILLSRNSEFPEKKLNITNLPDGRNDLKTDS